MMVFVPVSILGGLPVIADVWFSGPDYFGEYDCGVNAVYWQRKDGSQGREVSQSVYDRCDKYESYWRDYVTEQASDWLGCNCPTKLRDADEPTGYRTIGEWSPEYILLNGHPAAKAMSASGQDQNAASAVGETDLP